MEPSRIAFDARYVSDRYHGIGRAAFRLLEALVEAAPERTFVVFRGRAPDSRFDWESLARRPNVELHAGPWPLYWPHEQLLWPWLLRRARIDLFHSPYFVAPLLAGCPVLITIHDLIFDRYPEAMPQQWARPYYRALTQWSVRRARVVLTVSQATAADLAAPPYRVPPEKLRAIPHGVEPGFSALADPVQLDALRRRFDLARPFVLAVGARRPHKNLGRLVEAFARLAHSLPHDLLFAGPPDKRFPDEAREAAERAGLSARVRFLDWVSEEELRGLYTLADLVAMPSLIEGFGLPALEAMACGTPVLASERSSLPEVVGEAGVLVDPYDIGAIAAALERVLRDDRLRQRLSRAGRDRAATFSWQAAAQQTLAAYHDALGATAAATAGGRPRTAAGTTTADGRRPTAAFSKRTCPSLVITSHKVRNPREGCVIAVRRVVGAWH